MKPTPLSRDGLNSGTELPSSIHKEENSITCGICWYLRPKDKLFQKRTTFPGIKTRNKLAPETHKEDLTYFHEQQPENYLHNKDGNFVRLLPKTSLNISHYHKK